MGQNEFFSLCPSFCISQSVHIPDRMRQCERTEQAWVTMTLRFQPVHLIIHLCSISFLDVIGLLEPVLYFVLMFFRICLSRRKLNKEF